MDKKYGVLLFCVGLLCFVIALAGNSIGNGLREVGAGISYSKQGSVTVTGGNQAAPKNVMDIGEVANYLSMTQDEVEAIVNIEKNHLEKYGSFSGVMFPYFTVNGRLFFSKAELEDVTLNRREYDTSRGFVLQ